MRPFLSRLLSPCILALACIHGPLALGQGYLYETGTPTFTTQWPDQLGFINVSNGNIHIEIPLAQNAQRGTLHLDERLVYDSRIWQITPASTNYQWEPTNVANSMGGWRLVTGNEGGSHYYVTYTVSGTCGSKRTDPCVETYVFFWTDPGGTQHEFIGPTVDRTLPTCRTKCPTGFASAIDASGYHLEYVNLSSAANVSAVFDPNGTRIYPSVQDPNGNAWTKDSSGNLIDTLGRTPLKATVNGNQIYYDVLTFGGATSRYTVTTGTIDFHTAFKQEAVSELSGSFTAIESIELPDGSFFRFNYDSGTASGNYGELKSVTLPASGTITYGYGNYFDSYQNVNRWPTSRSDSAGITKFAPEVVTQCSSGGTGCVEKVTVAKPDQNDVVYSLTLNNGSWNTQVDEWNGSSTSGGGTKLRTTLPTYDYSHACGNPKICTGADVITKTNETVTLWDAAGGAVASQTAYATNLAAGKLSSVQQWDYYPVSSGPPSKPLLETAYSYNYLVNDAGLLTQATVTDGSSGTQVSQTTNTYDETTGTGHAPLTPTSGLPNHKAVTGNRGNLTTSQQWINTTGGTFSKTATYSDAGALLKSADPNGTTSYGYDSDDAYVTGVTPPTPSSGVTFSSTATYDASTGLPLTATDPNGAKTSYPSYDWAGRPIQINYPDGGEMNGSYSPTQIGVEHLMNASTQANTQTLLDAYGRTSRVAVGNGQSSNPYYQTDYCYDPSGRLHFKSYQYQGNGWATPMVCSGAGDTYTYDALGRLTGIAHSDGTSYTYKYTGRAVETKDANGVQRIVLSGALNNPEDVCEVSSQPQMSVNPVNCGLDIAGSGFLTTYSYNYANHSTTVVQGAQTATTQTRTFQTDSLGRTIAVMEPESGTTNYSYQYSGQAGYGLYVTRTGTASTINQQYDSLGRVVGVVSADGTVNKGFRYDAADSRWPNAASATNLKGHLAETWTSGTPATGSLYSYDIMGRVTSLWQCAPSICGTTAQTSRPLSFSYDYLGDVTSEVDINSGNIEYGYSPAQEVTSITNATFANTYNPAKLVSNVVNGPNGPLSWSLGNGLTAVNQYDTMGRRTGFWVCNGSVQPSCGGQAAVYGFVITPRGVRLTKAQDTLMGTMGLGYDDFNRLTSASYSIPLFGAPTFTNVYDLFGNRWQQNGLDLNGNSQNFSFNEANNQINSTGFTYNAAGQLINGPYGTYNSPSNSYTYDAVGNLLTASGGGTAQYVYDALNRRVSAQDDNGTWEYLYDHVGKRISTWYADPDFNTGAEGRIYWGDQQLAFLADNGTTYFDHQDWTGTERLRTNYAGSPAVNYFSFAYGDDLTWTYSGSDYESNQDNASYTGLDTDLFASTNTNHAMFREYNPLQGSWMSPDPSSGSYDPGNPQSFNRYSYALSNPLVGTDPTGLDGDSPISIGSTIGGCVGVAISEGGNPIADIGCGLSLFKDILGLFGGPSFHGSLTPRPDSTGDPSWDGNFGESLGIPTSIPQTSVGLALGLPSQGCEFGPCGIGPMAATDDPAGVPSNITVSIPPAAWYWATHGSHTPVSHLLWWHGNWCGVGGSGLPTDDADASCLIHDYCYFASGVSAPDNWLGAPAGKAPAMSGCNQQLCDNEFFSGGTVPSASIQVFFTFYAITGGRYGCNGKGPGY